MDPLVLVILGGTIFLVLMVVLVAARARRRREAEPLEPLLPPEDGEESGPVLTAEAEPEAEPEAEVLPETPPEPAVTEALPPAPPAEPPEKVVTPLRAGLEKTRRFLAERVASLARRERLDDEAWEEVEEALIQADVGLDAAAKILARVRRESPAPIELDAALRRSLEEILDAGDRTLGFAPQGPSLWLVVGVNGTGKTTSIAKIAHRLRSEGRSVVLAAADTFRAAAIDQLGAWADRLGVHMVRHAPGADPGAVVFDALEHAGARGIDVVVADTAGRLHTKSNLMEELKKIRRVAENRVGSIPEVLLVLDATVGQNGIAQARAFNEAVDVTGIVLTKLDGTARGGIVVAVQDQLGIPVKLVGVGESVEDLEEFEPRAFAEALLG